MYKYILMKSICGNQWLIATGHFCTKYTLKEQRTCVKGAHTLITHLRTVCIRLRYSHARSTHSLKVHTLIKYALNLEKNETKNS